MPDGPGGFAQDYSCPALLRMPLGPGMLRIQGFHLLRPAFPDRSPRIPSTNTWSYYPGRASPHGRFGLVPVRSPLLGESLIYFLFLRVLRCFSSPGSPHRSKNGDNYPSGNWVVPFGNPGVKGHLHLTRAYRSLSRPSSPPRAKASTGRPNLLSPFGGKPCLTHASLTPTGTDNSGPGAGCVGIDNSRLLILSDVVEIFSVASDLFSVRFYLCLYLQSCVPTCQRTPSGAAKTMQSASQKAPGRVENNGFEPLTPCLQSRCSSQLS